MKRLFFLAAMMVLATAVLIIVTRRETSLPVGFFTPPDGVNVTYFPALANEAGLPLVISGSTEAGFMRPFLIAFQRRHPSVSIAYLQSRSGAFLQQALDSCHRGEPAADIYVSASTDQLMRLANENCARTLPTSIGEAAPGQAHWRNEVIAFTVQPAVFVFAKPPDGSSLPTSHIALLEWLRRFPGGGHRVGIYDIEASADGYNFAASDARQSALYGRLLEGLGRAEVRLYCCSNAMVDAVDRAEIQFAYNVQLSYAYAAQRAGSRIAVVVPDDYQALQTLSLMVPKGARTPSLSQRFAEFMVSGEARDIARRGLAPPDEPRAMAEAHADALLAKAIVTPVLLSLQDHARRHRLIHEWRQAIVGPPSQGAQTPNISPIP